MCDSGNHPYSNSLDNPQRDQLESEDVKEEAVAVGVVKESEQESNDASQGQTTFSVTIVEGIVVNE